MADENLGMIAYFLITAAAWPIKIEPKKCSVVVGMIHA